MSSFVELPKIGLKFDLPMDVGHVVTTIAELKLKFGNYPTLEKGII